MASLPLGPRCSPSGLYRLSAAIAGSVGLVLIPQDNGSVSPFPERLSLALFCLNVQTLPPAAPWGFPSDLRSPGRLVTWKTTIICWLSVPFQLNVSCMEAGRGLFSSVPRAWHTAGASVNLAEGMTV